MDMEWYGWFWVVVDGLLKWKGYLLVFNLFFVLKLCKLNLLYFYLMNLGGLKFVLVWNFNLVNFLVFFCGC